MDTLIDSYKTLQEIEINYVKTDWDILEDALSYSLKNNISLYYAVYVVASKRLGANIVSADQELVKSLKNKEPNIINVSNYT